jgi:exonuclease III
MAGSTDSLSGSQTASRTRSVKVIESQTYTSTQGWITQNVRGFRKEKKNRIHWMQSWKQQYKKQQLHYILIQETHIQDKSEAEQMERQWCGMWGINYNPTEPISFWSYGNGRKAGVAILLNPFEVTEKYVRKTSEHHLNIIIIESKHKRIVNIYAPQGTQQQGFYRDLQEIQPFEGDTICGGDFNNTSSHEWDRCTNHQPRYETKNRQRVRQANGDVEFGRLADFNSTRRGVRIRNIPSGVSHIRPGQTQQPT